MTDRDERTTDAPMLDELLHDVGRELARLDDGGSHQSEGLLRWLADDLRAGQSGADRERDERGADAFAARVRQAHLVRQAERRLPTHVMQHRAPPLVATASQAIAMARRDGCAALLDLSAAAGEGRELWDEPCESWVELPSGLAKASHVALGVAGDSMTPVLDRRSVILVQIDATPALEDLVVARLQGDGYVVKRLASATAEHYELASFNPGYPPIVVRRDEVAILGVVVARLRRIT